MMAGDHFDDEFDDEVRGDHNGHDAHELGRMRDGEFIPHQDTHYARNISVGALAAVAVIAGIIVLKGNRQTT
jgi:hypothetical protein